MKKLIFMGTPQFSAICLNRLISCCNSGEVKDIEISAIVTQPDKPRGRGNVLMPSPVKELGVKYNIPIYQPQKLDEIYQDIYDLEPFMIIVVAYGKILSKKFLDIPTFGCINLHASLLPKYRGPAPIQWAIINGEKKTGVTTMLIDEGVDTGKIIMQEEVEIGEDETFGELSDKLALHGAELLVKTIKNILSIETNSATLNSFEDLKIPKHSDQKPIMRHYSGRNDRKGWVNFIPQDENSATYFPEIKKEDTKINWHESAERIRNKIRAFNPSPVAFTFYKGERLKIWEAKAMVTQNLASSGNETKKWRSQETPNVLADFNSETCIDMQEASASNKYDKSQNYIKGNDEECRIQEVITRKRLQVTDPGRILKVDPKGYIYVACGSGTLIITKLQREGKKVLKAEEFLRGYRILEGDFFGN